MHGTRRSRGVGRRAAVGAELQVSTEVSFILQKCHLQSYIHTHTHWITRQSRARDALLLLEAQFTKKLPVSLADDSTRKLLIEVRSKLNEWAFWVATRFTRHSSSQTVSRARYFGKPGEETKITTSTCSTTSCCTANAQCLALTVTRYLAW